MASNEIDLTFELKSFLSPTLEDHFTLFSLQYYVRSLSIRMYWQRFDSQYRGNCNRLHAFNHITAGCVNAGCGLT